VPPEEGHVDAPRPTVTSFAGDAGGELLAYLFRELRDGDVVLLKGSRGLRMDELVAALRVDAGEGTDPGAPGGAGGG
jgi:UDP-N-acetylmuramyl pentapeptide synthase